MALRGLRVLEFAGLAPAPMCGMMLADFGAEVVRVDKPVPYNPDRLSRGKKSVCLDLKHASAASVVSRMIASFDVVLEPFRPGVMESLKMGPDVLCKLNPALVYARLTGFGQEGPYAHMAGHDINYAGVSGVLSVLGTPGQRPTPPVNLLADFGGGALLCSFGILCALQRRHVTNKGQVVDASMVDGAAYMGTFLTHGTAQGYVGGSNPTRRGRGVLDGDAPFYRTYECKGGEFITVGCLEPKFFAEFVRLFGMNPDEVGDQMDQESWPTMAKAFEQRFKTRTVDEWMGVFGGSDACVLPMIQHDTGTRVNAHAKARKLAGVRTEDDYEPAPAPLLSETPAGGFSRTVLGPRPFVDQHTTAVLLDCGFSQLEIDQLQSEGIVGLKPKPKL